MESSSDEAPVLMAQGGPLDGQRWMLRETLTIGRDSACEVVVPDRQVSRRHARMTCAPEGVYLEDLGSKNGTHLNGRPLREKTLLQDGDSIQISIAQGFVFISADATMPLLSSPSAETKTPLPKLHLMKHSRQVWIDDQEIDPPLSVAQFKLLELLYNQKDRVVSRQTLIQEIWGPDAAGHVSNQALDALIRRLRDRLAEVDPRHHFIVTVRGHGLRLENPGEAA